MLITGLEYGDEQHARNSKNIQRRDKSAGLTLLPPSLDHRTREPRV